MLDTSGQTCIWLIYVPTRIDDDEDEDIYIIFSNCLRQASSDEISRMKEEVGSDYESDN